MPKLLFIFILFPFSLFASLQTAILLEEKISAPTLPESRDFKHKIMLGYYHAESTLDHSTSPLPLAPKVYLPMNGAEIAFEREFYFESLWSTGSLFSLNILQGRGQVGDAQLFHKGNKELVHQTYHEEANFYGASLQQLLYYSFINQKNYILKPFIGLGIQQKLGHTVLNYALKTPRDDLQNFNSEIKVNELSGLGYLGLHFLNYHYGVFSYLKVGYQYFLKGTLTSQNEQFFENGDVRQLGNTKISAALDKQSLTYSIGIGMSFAQLGL